MASLPSVRIGVVGFGSGGMKFHAPFIETADGVTLAGVVTRDPARRQWVAQRHPGVPVFDTLQAMAASGLVVAVTLTTPPQTRRDLVLEALGLGLHVVADKPFAPDAATARELQATAQAAGRRLAVYHNRRWDSDIRTLKAVLDAQAVGTVRRFHSRFDLDEPGTMEPGPAGGLLRDLGSHLVDQALWLCGPVARVYARLDWVESAGGRTDAGFALVLTHVNGVDTHLSASKLNRLQARELRVYGSKGSYVSHSTDVQASAVNDGMTPRGRRETWGFEPESAWGTLATADERRRVPAQQGDYSRYYEAFAQAVRLGTPLPVSASEAVAVIEVLDAARHSDAESVAVHVAPERMAA